MLLSFAVRLCALAVLVSSSSPQVLLITQTDPNLPSCLSDFLGAYGVIHERYLVYRAPADCGVAQGGVRFNEAASIHPIRENTRVVYLQEAGVEQSVRGGQASFLYELEAFQERLRLRRAEEEEEEEEEASAPSAQKVLSPPSPSPSTYEVEVLYKAANSALVSVPDSLLPVLDTLLPRLFVPVVLPEDPLPLLPVPQDAVKRVSDVLASLRFNPDVAGIITRLSIPKMRDDIHYLAGEAGASHLLGRHSFTKDARVAAGWIKAQIESTGATCTLKTFMIGFAPNVVCRYAAIVNTTATVLLSAHYDSRGSFGSVRAPGANDDGSGVLSVLAIARVIGEKQIKFLSNVELVAFAGEEQGLFGSQAYARELRDAGANLTLMIQADMLAYHNADEPPQLALPEFIGTPVVAQLVGNVSGIYSPELTVGTSRACCSDHQSFHERGFPSTQVFERAGPIADPMYHNSGDLSERGGYDLKQVRSIAKVTFATLLHTAGFKV